MKEVVEAINNRIKTPYFGYSILAFIALNWRGVFLMMTSKKEPTERLALFDLETSIWTLVVYPLLIGAFIAITFHWLRYFFRVIERVPRELVENLSLEAEHKRIIKQTQLEEARTKLFAMKEEELIDRAKRDEEVADIQNSVTKDKLAAQLNKLRNEKDLLTKELEERVSPEKALSKEAITILREAAKDKQGTIMVIKTFDGNTIQVNKKEFGAEDQRAFSKYEAALDELIKNNLVKELGHKGEVFELTSSGWEIADML
jgi:hypothetical protein